MKPPTVFLDPTSEVMPAQRPRVVRPDTLTDLNVGILDISKSRGNVFLDRLDETLKSRGIGVKRYMKPTFARVAPDALKQQIASECDVVIEGLAD